MDLHLWVLFVGAAILLLLIPGPTVLQCIGDALANRQQQNWSTILGVGLGDGVAMSLSLVGAGALLRTSAAAFTVMKTIGGAYLLYLGVRSILRARKLDQQNEETGLVSAKAPERASVRFSKAGAITMLNPKSILFFVAFVPQFIAPGRSFVVQAGILLATFVGLSMLNAWGYMSVAGALGRRLQSRSAQRGIGYASGGLLSAAGLLTLRLRRG